MSLRCFLLIDGGFKEVLLDYSRPFVSSSNQGYIFPSEHYTKKDNSSIKIRIVNNVKIIIYYIAI